MKIEKLTQKQEIELKEFYENALKTGRSIEPISREKCEKIIGKFYKRIGKNSPKFIYLSSPAMCILAGGVLKNTPEISLRAQLGGQLWDQLRGQLWNQLRSQLRDQLRDQLGGQLRDQLGVRLRIQFRSQLWDQLRSQLWDQLWNQLRDQLRDQLGGQLRDQLNNYFAGQQWLYWQSYYKFCQKIGVVYEKSQIELLDEWIEEGESLHWWFPYERFILISERPIRLSVNSRGQLHNEVSMAIEYSDGWGIHSLNGVRVPKELVETPSEKLNLEFFKEEKSADIKAEFVRKFGVERMLDFGSKIDSYKNYDEDENPWWHKSQYELWDMAAIFPTLNFQPYLKMQNQTTGIWHMEAVSPNCRNLREAIKERFGGRDMKILSIS